MIDIHAHILPGIDDGSQSAEESLEMLKEARESGFTDIITTSHYIYNGDYCINKYERNQIIKALQGLADFQNVNIKLHNGAEAYIMPELEKLYNMKEIPTLANSRYVLFELPMNSKVMYVHSVIRQLIASDYIPIIAHPERYSFVQRNYRIAIEWVNNGAYLQCNYGSILGRYGDKAKKTLVKLLKADVVSFLGTDTHREHSFYTEMDYILKALKKEIGIKKLEDLTTNNPDKILKNETL